MKKKFKPIIHLIEIKEENSSNMFHITLNENLYFKPCITFPTSYFKDYTISVNKGYIILMLILETDVLAMS